MTTPDTGRTGVDRREFLRRVGLGAVTVVGASYGLSTWGSHPTGAATMQAGDPGARAEGRTLVIVELGGGNDGLNTVVPYADGRYHDLRPTLAVADPLELDAEIGLHPNLAKLAKRYEAGQVAIVEGLGYDDADLSHFGSFAIWWSAKGGAGGPGWLGSYLDATVGFDEPLAAIGIGPLPSPALRGARSFATTIADASGLQPRLPAWAGDTDALFDAWRTLVPTRIEIDQLIGQVQRDVDLTVEARGHLAKALGGSAQLGVQGSDSASQGRRYQDASVADALTLAAQLVKSSAKPRIVYISGVGDFDTHEGQATRHPLLLEQLDAGIEAFFDTAGAAADDAVLMTISEFGRRPAENGSGTDHGTANAHFIVGPKVRGGRYGAPPSLTNLDANENLRHTDDFRRLYSTGLHWLGAESEPVLGDDYDAFPVFDRA